LIAACGLVTARRASLALLARKRSDDDNQLVETAQEAFAAMLRDGIAPALRRLGLRGSGSAFTLPDDRHWLMVGLQKSLSSDRESVRFTVNLTVADKAAWTEAFARYPWLGRHPSGNSRYPVGEVKRIGSLTPTRTDLWWEVRPRASSDAVAAAVVAAIAAHGLPWLRSRQGRVKPGAPG
jgi:hypothetical protein